ncbi:NmrA family NAD(P)-binding protein [Burkholderia gladioli]|uniref:NmrA family NAD(P)-binding protein n=1 Tax=Burkholderia gladioli TaxID=28095 RepID=UPI00163EDD83|nr:NAD(P)H-binding protein [Burkholderia gladioli]MBJ9662455.1 NAD(P)H-binding protein [Burkholderia gladioli]
MYAITGITGKVGGALGRQLLSEGRPVRAVVRDAGRAGDWAARGCEIATAGMDDAPALAAAFENTRAVFVLPPSDFDPEPGFPKARRIIDAVVAALRAARPERVLCLSTIGAQAGEMNLLTQRGLMEQALRELPMPVTLLRPGWFIENASRDIESAREHGLIASFLQPLARPVPMNATADVGRVAARLIQESWQGLRVVEMEGPRRLSPHDLAAAFSRVLGKPVQAEAVDRRAWDTLFRAQGMRHPLPRMRMLDGFNEGWIDYERTHGPILKGEVEVDAVLRELIARAG